ncbi:hypothetical protein CRV24_004675 [Beauveria bassiana]|nr:hypothetical protein CRV24_004675 [Beauveria bassiana]
MSKLLISFASVDLRNVEFYSSSPGFGNESNHIQGICPKLCKRDRCVDAAYRTIEHVCPERLELLFDSIFRATLDLRFASKIIQMLNIDFIVHVLKKGPDLYPINLSTRENCHKDSVVLPNLPYIEPFVVLSWARWLKENSV